ncbi:hypothetical protein NC651_017489 [Populus alba x Populus x berolinensis]|nr:hypothetical protein NC651_017489 [Populus alba x Populus x berolinensis]
MVLQMGLGEMILSSAKILQLLMQWLQRCTRKNLKLPNGEGFIDRCCNEGRFGESVGHLLDPNASILKSAAAATGQPSGKCCMVLLVGCPHRSRLGISSCQGPRRIKSRWQQFDSKRMGTPCKFSLVQLFPENSTLYIARLWFNFECTIANNMLTVNVYAYWTISCLTLLLPCQGLEQLRSGLLQPQKPFIQAPQPFHQIQMLTPQHQQLMLAQQNLTSPAASDDSRRLRMLLNNRTMSIGKDGLTNSVGDVFPNVGSPLQTGGPLLSRGDPDIMMKFKIAQLHQQQQQQQQNSNPQHQLLQQHVLSNQQSQSSNHNLHPQEKMGDAGSVNVDGSISNSFRGNDQVSKNQTGRKRKQPVSSSGPANSSELQIQQDPPQVQHLQRLRPTHLEM